MDTGLLATFREVARQGSITGATRTLPYTQSAVSRQIAALETAFGLRLFDRRRRGVQLTEHGRCLLEHADAVLERIDLAQRELDALGRLETGRIRIGCFDTAAAALVPRAMAALTAAHPHVSLTLIAASTSRQLDRLRGGDLDVAVVSAFPGQALDTDLRLVHLIDDGMLVALPRSHPLAQRSQIRVSELETDRWIGADRSDDARILGPARLVDPAPPRSLFPVSNWTAKLGLVAAGLGVTLVPSLATAAARPDIVLVSLDPRDAPGRKVYAATPTGVSIAPATQAFLEALTEAANQLRSESTGRPE